jgi:hypothetical protein
VVLFVGELEDRVKQETEVLQVGAFILFVLLNSVFPEAVKTFILAAFLLRGKLLYICLGKVC